jgi:hypothetical protein
MSSIRRWFSKRFALPVVLVLLLATIVATPSPAAAIGLGVYGVEADCGGVSLTYSWGGAPVGGRVSAWLYHPDAGTYYGYTVLIDDTNQTGSQAVDLPFGAEILDGWQILLVIEDETNMTVFGHESDPFSRECFEGSVGPGGTGDGSVEAVDSRSGDVADPVEPAESADDPDDDARVQVP